MEITVSDGLHAEAFKAEDELCVHVSGLKANQFGNVFTLTIGDTTLQYNGYAYIASVTKYDSNERLLAMMRGVYRYARASEEAFGIDTNIH